MSVNLTLSEEYDAMFEELGDTGSAFWKFFSMFSINETAIDEKGKEKGKGVSFGSVGTWATCTDEQLKELKSYWREQKKWIRKEGLSVSGKECRRRMWFFMCRIIEWGMFSVFVRREIYWWFDTCEERIMIAK